MSKVLTFFVFKRKKPLLSGLLPCHSYYLLHPDFVVALTALILVLKKCIRSMIPCVEIRFSPWPTEQILICLILRAFLIYFRNHPPPAFTTMKRFSLPFVPTMLTNNILTVATDNHTWPLFTWILPLNLINPLRRTKWAGLGIVFFLLFKWMNALPLPLKALSRQKTNS